MILEELIGSWLALISSFLGQTPPISRQNLETEYTLISVPNPEEEEVNNGLIHTEYEQSTVSDVPYYEDGTFAQTPAGETRTFLKSFVRSFKTNIGLITAAVAILAALSVGLVLVDLNTNDICAEWIHKNLKVPSHAMTARKVGMSVKQLPFFSWFPVSIAMLWGFKEFRRNYFKCLFLCAFVPVSITCAYRIILFHKFTNLVYNIYR